MKHIKSTFTFSSRVQNEIKFTMKSNNISLLLFKTKYFFLNTRDILLKNGGNLNITSSFNKCFSYKTQALIF